jgi:hypothetical protein
MIHLTINPMKTVLVFLFTLLGLSAIAQEQQTFKKVSFGLGLGYGIFYPSELNEYIQDDYANRGYELTNSDMYLYFRGNASLTFRPVWRFELVGTAEFAAAPKMLVMDTGGTESYSFNRFSPGVLANLHFRVGSRHSIFIGAGGMRHGMKFKSMEASKMGLRTQVGFSLNFKKINPRVIVGADLLSAAKTDGITPIELNYNSGFMGIGINF